jgi:hypothetical protein
MIDFVQTFSASKNFLFALTITAVLCTFTSCEEEEPQSPSSSYYVTYTWDGEADYILTYWLQSEEQQHLSLSTGSASSQGSYTSPIINHVNTLDLDIKTAIEYTSNDCANVQMTLYRDSLPVLTRDYIMGNPDNQNCTGDNLRQATYTP